MHLQRNGVWIGHKQRKLEFRMLPKGSAALLGNAVQSLSHATTSSLLFKFANWHNHVTVVRRVFCSTL